MEMCPATDCSCNTLNEVVTQPVTRTSAEILKSLPAVARLANSLRCHVSNHYDPHTSPAGDVADHAD